MSACGVALRGGYGLHRAEGRQGVADLRRLGAAVELPRAGVDVLIVLRRPFVLPQMLVPTRQEEPLDPDAGFGRILVDAPLMRAVALAFAGKLVQDRKSVG